jgi:C_GCAxxG_C_C family probable redox protein
MKSKKELAVEKFQNGFNCAQSILYAFRDEGNLEGDIALKMATGLGAGMGRKVEICGAVSGGILVLGFRHGRGENDEPPVAEITFTKTRELMDRFADKHGTYNCRQLINGCDLATDEGKLRFKEENLRTETCLKCVESVAGILEEI